MQDSVQVNNIHNPAEQITNWQQALLLLKEGNKRYLSNSETFQDTNESLRELTKDAQKPFAVVLTCSDSRAAPEIIFNQKIGDLFVIRNAGHTIDISVLGSVEYAVLHLKTPLVTVMGHSKCGAVTGALQGGKHPENLQSVLGAILPSIKNCNNLDEAVRANIRSAVRQIEEDTVIKECNAAVIGAYYCLETGEVTFFDA